MSDRSREETLDAEDGEGDEPSTESLLAETEALLEDVPGGSSRAGPSNDDVSTREPTGSEEDSSGIDGPETDPGASEGASGEPAGDALGIGRVTGAVSSLVPRSASVPGFSPKAAVAIAATLAAGMVGAGMVVPIAGRLVGLFAASFLLGLVLSRRYYLEVTAAGVVVGGVAALVNHAVLAIAGSVTAVATVGVTAGVLAALVGYYLGRDLRGGLTAELDGGGEDRSDSAAEEPGGSTSDGAVDAPSESAGGSTSDGAVDAPSES